MSAMREDLDAVRSVQRMLAGVLPQEWSIELALEASDVPGRPLALVEQTAPSATAGPAAGQSVTVPITISLYFALADTRLEALEDAATIRDVIWQAVKYGVQTDRMTTDLIPLWRYVPQVEAHRYAVTATGGTFTIHLAGATTMAITPTDSATAVAAHIASALGPALGLTLTAEDVVPFDRGDGLWDVRFDGQLAGRTFPAPTIDASQLTGLQVSASASVLLVGRSAPWRNDRDFMRVDPGSFAIAAPIRDPANPALVMVPVDLRCTFVRGARLPSNYRILQRLRPSP